MSLRASPSLGRLCWLVGRENGAPPGTIRRIRLVGKRTRNTNREILASTSSLVGTSPCFVPFLLADSLRWRPLKGEYLSGLRGAAQTSSYTEGWLWRVRKATWRRGPHKLFALHDLPIAVRRRGLTGESPKRYIPVRRGRSRRGGLSKSPNGPVEGFVPGNCGERGLTECEARSTASNLRAEGWSVSRPLSAIHIFQLRSMKP